MTLHHTSIMYEVKVYVQPQDKESVLLSTVPERNTNKFTSRTVEHIRFNYGFISKFEQLRLVAGRALN